jgi:hypothetical protein
MEIQHNNDLTPEMLSAFYPSPLPTEKFSGMLFPSARLSK